MKSYLLIYALLFVLISCINNEADKKQFESDIYPQSSDLFADYWYNGKAEINKYKVQQARYGEMREAESVLIFVKEDFLLNEQVKYEGHRPDAPKSPVLKLNHMRDFQTGVYPYRMMNSVFSPIAINELPHALKSTTSVQEWCGISFAQLNNTYNGFEFQLRSYFEKEGDQQIQFDQAWLEDEIFNYIRIAPDQLPKGEILMFPSTFYQRLSHIQPKLYKAVAQLSQKGQYMQYVINYPELKRTVSIQFSKDFPYVIQSWQEQYPEGNPKELMTTSAQLQSTARLDYWKRNKRADEGMLLDMWSQKSTEEK